MRTKSNNIFRLFSVYRQQEKLSIIIQVLIILFLQAIPCAASPTSYYKANSKVDPTDVISIVRQKARESKRDSEGEWERGFFLGVGVGKSFFLDDNNTHYSQAFDLAFQLGYDVLHYLSVGMKFGMIAGDGAVHDGAREQGIIFPFVDAFLKFKPFYTRFSPYLVTGLGCYFGDEDLQQNDRIKPGNHFHMDTGIGIEFNITRKNTLATETIYHYLSNPAGGLHTMNINLVYRFTF